MNIFGYAGCNKPKGKEILEIRISKKERNMFVAIESFLSTVIDEYGKRFIPTENGGTWYSQSCKFFKLEHHIHFFVYKNEKCIIERTM